MSLAWVSFAELVAARLEKGREVYGDRSFSLMPLELTKEVEEEILEVCAWSFILWTRLRAQRRRLPSETKERSASA
ncbi:MAG: hypothetical protein ACREQ9_18765 [Candidatus Binatia bacterium]